MTTSTTGAPAGERLEGVVQVAIMLVIGGMAGAASFTHVHDVAVAHGQPDWIGWADAVVVELMSIALGLELRRRARTLRPTGFVLTALVTFIAASLSAQVVEAEPSIIGWLAAALPALGFLVLAKVVLSRTAAHHTTTVATTGTTDVAPATARSAGTAQVERRPDTEPARRFGPADASVPAHLLTPARFAVTNHRQATGRAITADELAARMSITDDVAVRLLNALDTPTTPASPAASARPVNGAQLVFGGVS
jgi:Protein of unknown function (DUF2637)